MVASADTPAAHGVAQEGRQTERGWLAVDFILPETGPPTGKKGRMNNANAGVGQTMAFALGHQPATCIE